MSNYLSVPIVLIALLFGSYVSAAGIGFREAQVEDEGGGRPLSVGIWYPALPSGSDGQTPEIQASVAENRAFFGVEAIVNAEPESSAHPLVLLSHGYGGNWRNLSWLAAELARAGYVVAAPDHPGTSTFDRRPSQATRLWKRPHDLGRVIDLVLEQPTLAGAIDRNRIAAIGHSLGGWTVIALAGARFSEAQMASECRLHPNPRICGLIPVLGLDRSGRAKTELEGDMSDARVRAVVSLDLGLARGFTAESLGRVSVPVLLVGAGVDIGDLPASMESGYLARHLPTASTRYMEISDATHFSFLSLCKPGAAELIEADSPGEGIVCRDGDGRSRAAIHRQVSDSVRRFLERSIPSDDSRLVSSR